MNVLIFRTLLSILAHNNVLPSYEQQLKEIVIIPAAIICSKKNDHWILLIGDPSQKKGGDRSSCLTLRSSHHWCQFPKNSCLPVGEMVPT